jgi:acetyl/propionyl-CoA carboxylase alpha subunit
MPAGPGVRVDTATEPGDRVPPDYDPLIAKLLVVGDDRQSALARLRRALDEVEVTGIQTTLPFLRFVARDEAFAAAELSTGFVTERWDATAHRRAALAEAVLVAAGQWPRQPTAGPVSLRKDSPLGEGWRAAARRAAIDRWPRQ